MTYCVGLLVDTGLVMLSDSRTNAGVDQINTFRKMATFQHAHDRVLVLMSAGNLAITQAVTQCPAAEALMAVHIEGRHEEDRHALEHPRGRRFAEDFAQRDEARVLAVALARMNAGLEQKYGHAARIGATGEERAHRPSFG